ncbi:MAG: MaoC family dehydratase [Candidatus Geothermarchaeales archaeon]
MGYYYEDFEIGNKVVTRSRIVSSADVELFASFIGAYNPLFLSEEVAKSKGFRGKIAPGPLTIAFSFGLEYQAGIYDNIIALLGIDDLRFKAPLLQGDELRSELEVINKRETSRGDRGIVTFQRRCYSGRGEEVMEAKVTLMFFKRNSTHTSMKDT